MKKVLSCAIAATVLVSTIPSAGVFAETLPNNNTQAIVEATNSLSSKGIKIKSIKDDDNVRVVEAVENGVNTTASFDKKNNTLTLEVENKAPIIINLNNALNQTTNDNTAKIMATVGENTLSNYEYEIDLSPNPDVWELRRPDPDAPLTAMFYKTVTESSSNQSNLNSFKSAVEEINTLEFEFLGYSTGSVLSSVISILVTSVSAGTGAGTLLVAIGITGKALQTALKLENKCEDAYYYYFSV